MTREARCLVKGHVPTFVNDPDHGVCASCLMKMCMPGACSHDFSKPYPASMFCWHCEGEVYGDFHVLDYVLCFLKAVVVFQVSIVLGMTYGHFVNFVQQFSW